MKKNKRGVPKALKNPFQLLADAAGDTYVGFNLEKERNESWSEFEIESTEETEEDLN